MKKKLKIHLQVFEDILNRDRQIFTAVVFPQCQVEKRSKENMSLSLFRCGYTFFAVK